MNKLWKECAPPEEKKFLEKITGIHSRAIKQNRCLATDFYPREWMIEVITRYIGKDFLQECKFHGGYNEAERVCILFGYEIYYEDQIPIGGIKIEINTGIGKALSHRDYLGALLGLGLERDKIGDIIIKSFGAFVIIHESLQDFVAIHLRQIGRYEIDEIEQVDLSEIIVDPPRTKAISGTVASLRADAVYAVAFGISRSLVAKLLQGEKGKRNNMMVKSTDLLNEGDLLTLKGYGKARFKGVSGQTKKERYHISLEKYI